MDICVAQTPHLAPDPLYNRCVIKAPMYGHLLQARPVLSFLLDISFHVILTQGGRDYYNPRFICEETEAQGHSVDGSGRVQS